MKNSRSAEQSFSAITELYSLTERPSWHADAACRGVGSELFFPARGESVSKARAYCDGCPVVAQCLASAIEHRDGGVWAGTSGRQRRKIVRLPVPQQPEPDDIDLDVAAEA